MPGIVWAHIHTRNVNDRNMFTLWLFINVCVYVKILFLLLFLSLGLCSNRYYFSGFGHFLSALLDRYYDYVMF